MAARFPNRIEWRPSANHVVLYLLSARGALNGLLIVRAFQIGSPVKAAICSLTRVLLTLFSGVVLFSEQITLVHAAGGALLLSSISLVIWARDRDKRRSAQELLLEEPL